MPRRRRTRLHGAADVLILGQTGEVPGWFTAEDDELVNPFANPPDWCDILAVLPALVQPTAFRSKPL